MADAAQVEPVLDLDEIQGNSIAGFNKDFQTHLYLRFDGSARAKKWIAELAPYLSTVREVQAFNQLYRRMRMRRRSRPRGFVATWINIAFSADGIRKLRGAADVDQFLDEAFKEGLAPRSAALGDPTDGSDGDPAHWLVGGTTNNADAVVIVASDDAAKLALEVDVLERSIGATNGAVAVIYKIEGAVLPGELIGHEHFGFKDGISQPVARGRKSAMADDFFVPRLVDPTDPQQMKPTAPERSAPGDILIWPGQFVFGYPTQDSSHPRRPGGVIPLQPAWIKNGSYVVVRRLRQDVAAFRKFVAAEAKRLAALPGFAGMTGDRLGALLVGRWRSGAPLMRSPAADSPQIAADGFANNHFAYSSPSKALKMRNGYVDPFTQAGTDDAGAVCPFAAHIRKVNPRDGSTEQGGRNDTFTRTILRRGIPFGPALSLDEKKADPAKGDRGLVFVSYQTSIERQFEFLTTTWVNSPDKPQAGKGHDPIIASATSPPAVILIGSNGEIETLQVPVTWIVPTGGGYFFSPSVSAVRDVLGA